MNTTKTNTQNVCQWYSTLPPTVAQASSRGYDLLLIFCAILQPACEQEEEESLRSQQIKYWDFSASNYVVVKAEASRCVLCVSVDVSVGSWRQHREQWSVRPGGSWGSSCGMAEGEWEVRSRKEQFDPPGIWFGLLVLVWITGLQFLLVHLYREHLKLSCCQTTDFHFV